MIPEITEVEANQLFNAYENISKTDAQKLIALIFKLKKQVADLQAMNDFKICRFRVTQQNLQAPVLTYYGLNTIGNFILSYQNAGSYQAIIPGGWNANKVFILNEWSSDSDPQNAAFYSVDNNGFFIQSMNYPTQVFGNNNLSNNGVTIILLP